MIGTADVAPVALAGYGGSSVVLIEDSASQMLGGTFDSNARQYFESALAENATEAAPATITNAIQTAAPTVPSTTLTTALPSVAGPSQYLLSAGAQPSQAPASPVDRALGEGRGGFADHTRQCGCEKEPDAARRVEPRARRCNQTSIQCPRKARRVGAHESISESRLCGTGGNRRCGNRRSASGSLCPISQSGKGRIADILELDGTQATLEDLKSTSTYLKSVKGGLSSSDIEAEFRSSSEIAKQHQVEQDLLAEARRTGGQLIIQGRDPVTGATVRLSLYPANVHSRVTDYTSIGNN